MKKRVSNIAGLIMLSVALTAVAQPDVNLDITDNEGQNLCLEEGCNRFCNEPRVGDWIKIIR